MNKRVVYCVCIASLLVGHEHSYAIQFETGYEPFLIKQFNPVSEVTYQNGSSVDGKQKQGAVNLLFHLVSLRWRFSQQLFEGRTSIGVETGVSASLIPVRKAWTIPGLADFTGTVEIPGSISVNGNGDYWENRSISLMNPSDTNERYLAEYTSLAYFPLNLEARRGISVGEKINVDVRAFTGFSLFYISTERKRLTGNPSTELTQISRSMTHLSKTLGAGLAFAYKLNSNVAAFLNFDANAVEKLSDFQWSPSQRIDGYRFDGLRYNAKLGVSWKI